MEFAWGAVTAVIAALIGFFADIGRTRLGEKAERRRVIKERSDRAAEDIVPLLDEVRAHFSGDWKPGEGPTPDDLRPSLEKIRQKSILLADASVRQQIDLAAEVFEHHSTVEKIIGDLPGWMADRTWREARETLARALNDQPFQASEVLAEYKAAIAEEDARLTAEIKQLADELGITTQED